ncbi:hypothetical protein [Nocardia sp. NPDC060249]|uniref:hypothetical protein n=1 Tax=Nocardia sp. NPDC060249 TaxID=3347082 RepID=UPI0036516E42
MGTGGRTAPPVPLCTESEIAVSVVTLAVIFGFAGSLLLIRVLGRLNTSHTPMVSVGVLPVRPTVEVRRPAMMDR